MSSEPVQNLNFLSGLFVSLKIRNFTFCSWKGPSFSLLADIARRHLCIVNEHQLQLRLRIRAFARAQIQINLKL